MRSNINIEIRALLKNALKWEKVFLVGYVEYNVFEYLSKSTMN